MRDPTGSQEQCRASQQTQPSACEENHSDTNGGRNWLGILIGEDTASQLSWTHGGEFITGGAMLSFTTFGAAAVVAGGVLADVVVTPARPFADFGCITCQVAVGALGPVYKFEFEHFIEPSFPWHVGEAAVETAQETLSELSSCWEEGITKHYTGGL